MQSESIPSRRKFMRDIATSTVAAMVIPCLGASEGCGVTSNILAPMSISSIQQPLPAGIVLAAKLIISDKAVGALSDYFLGLSYEKSSVAADGLFGKANMHLANCFNALGRGVLRIGGNSVDRTIWVENGTGGTPGEIAPADIDALAQFISQTQWKVLYGVNLATSTPALAAQECAYAQQKLGSALIGFEIGNEPDDYTNNYFPGWSLQRFESMWSAFRISIMAAVPSALITGPACGTHAQTWTSPFSAFATKQRICLLTQHYYRGDGQLPSSTAAELITPDAQLIQIAHVIQQAARGIGVPWRMSETNSYYNGGARGASDTYASALWVIDHLLTIASLGGSGVNMHGGNNAPYTPIESSGAQVIEVKPEYYGMLLVSMAGHGTILSTKFENNGINATAYAMESPDGLTAIIVNKDEANNLHLDLAFKKFGRTAELIVLSGPSLTATSGLKIAGTQVSSDGSFTPNAKYAPLTLLPGSLSCFVPALSAVLVQIR